MANTTDKEFSVTYTRHDWQGRSLRTSRKVFAPNRKAAYSRWLEMTTGPPGRQFESMSQVVMRAETVTNVIPRFV
jgi:hypothetical protein